MTPSRPIAASVSASMAKRPISQRYRFSSHSEFRHDLVHRLDVEYRDVGIDFAARGARGGDNLFRGAGGVDDKRHANVRGDAGIAADKVVEIWQRRLV